MKILKIWELVLIPRKVLSSGSTWHIAGFRKDLLNNENTESTVQSGKRMNKKKRELYRTIFTNTGVNSDLNTLLVL